MVSDRSGAARRILELELAELVAGAAAQGRSGEEKAPPRLAVDIQLTPELVTSVTGLIAAIGVAIKTVRDNRRGRRERKQSDKALEKVARAAARHSSSVRDVVNELEDTGTFQRPTPRDDNGTG